ncbi:MBL fold metallo-hydrolase [Flavobacteriaceae bacterium]|nr:MBL fold metallo-hydrolase [Flavobacteriaceae bacterium]MDA9318814.1 MBL fold metallo-hydrolase [Flavobacteriaceae bacterium]MDB4093294.1 MBL fold metallo-hydrolase [Flavobacteriaceae bacterium]MDB4097898.1 MBL fold metallo-hydrolase [Flavobacteriaceae bacterium]|tara:strand:+ start:14743 stop:16128 length:1386 start_codon:yes stop_codon:yes gene_type:complete
MIVKQIYTGCLFQGAYYVESNGEAAVIDPLREVSEYLNLAESSHSKIKYIFETHFHADFISGHLTLSKKTNSPIIFGPKANPSFDCIVAEDNQVFKIGDISITVLHTPGHTLESTCYLLKDENDVPHCLFTGDTLFIGDVGRPDLAQKSLNFSKEELAGILYDSIQNRIAVLPDNILIYPAHGAGSACGKNMMKETVDTLGNQKIVNYALNGSLLKNEFINELTKDLPDPPVYFPSNVKLNQEGYDDFELVLNNSLIPLDVKKFKELMNIKNVVVLDVRNQNEFKQGYVPGSIFIGLNGSFAPWVGSIIKDINTKLLLVCDEGLEKETILRLSRVGFDNCLGYLDGGFSSWSSNNNFDIIESVSAEDLSHEIEKVNLIDVRKSGERLNGYLLNSKHISLDSFQEKITEIDIKDKHYVHCAGGYRSMIACSILKRNGYNSVVDVEGGFSSIRNSNFKIIKNV